MKVTLAWNVWNNYSDVLLGSEIARLQNNENKIFDQLHLISQGGYPEPPSQAETKYLDRHVKVEIDKEYELMRVHAKFSGVYRILNGVKTAYQHAVQAGSDFAVVTNADAWFLDLKKLRRLLERDDVTRSAMSARIGLVTALDLSFGDFVPFFDDHFIILNIGTCGDNGVFDYEGDPRTYEGHFKAYGGIHYLFVALADELVPPGLFTAYTYFEDCLNHFGEKCGYSLLPWNYQPSFGFLHANCAEQPELLSLRAELLCVLGFSHYPEVAQHRRECMASAAGRKRFVYSDGYVALRQRWWRRVKIMLMFAVIRSYYSVLRLWMYRRYAQTKQRIWDTQLGSLHYFDKYWDVLPLILASRRR